ncbi:MAG: UvrD-helicase domain-containing protein [Alphaproteobacteria bacterium]
MNDNDMLTPNQPATPDFPWLAGLNDAQAEAVKTIEGAVLLLAGAGTGKTRALTSRLAQILASRAAMPGQVLAVTFTNKAAREMRERVAYLIGDEHVQGMWMGTFHSIAARILRRHADVLGLKSNFTILDTDDQIRLIKQIMDNAGISHKMHPARAVLSVIERWKDRALTPEKITSDDAGDLANGQLPRLYRDYQERLIELNACDFGDLLLHNITLFQNHAEILQRYHAIFRYVLVDEYQDTNVAQYLWLRLLAQRHGNICVVGDDDQSIYGWRGAEVGNILRFEQDFPGAKVIRLEQNYRSTGHILAAASAVIDHNKGRLGKTLWTADDDGEKPQITACWDGESEAQYITDQIEDATGRKSAADKEFELDDVAVLCRTGAQMRSFEERFNMVGLPYRVIGGPRFYERMEVRDALAYLRVVLSPVDDLAFERIINTPKRGIGPKALQTLQLHARSQQISLHDAAEQLAQSDQFGPKMRKTLGGLIEQFERWRMDMNLLRPEQLAQAVLEESGYIGMWKADKTPEAPGRIENLEEFVTATAEFDNLQGFLEHVALVTEGSDNTEDGQVTLMTLHAAKGLEFGFVCLPGWEEGLFPSQRAVDETGIAGLEEERRLAYVAITRARRRCLITHVSQRFMHGQFMNCLPSRFIEELPPAHVEHESSMAMRHSGVGGGFNLRGWDDDGTEYSGGGFRGGSGGSGASSGGGTAFNSKFNQMGQRHAARFAPSETRRMIENRAKYKGGQPEKSSESYQPGDRVFHDKFGYGEVLKVENEKVQILFDKAGEKNLFDSFIRPADQA